MAITFDRADKLDLSRSVASLVGQARRDWFYPASLAGPLVFK
jgi:hypothetical protein